jgi:hypothetical protein
MRQTADCWDSPLDRPQVAVGRTVRLLRPPKDGVHGDGEQRPRMAFLPMPRMAVARRPSCTFSAYFAKYFVPRRCPLVLSFFPSMSLITGSFSSFVGTPMPLPICSIDWPSLAAT